MLKKALWIVVPCFAVVAFTILELKSCSRQHWERTLNGPFPGIAYTGSITSSPASVLAIADHGRLEVHELGSQTNPVVVLRSRNGEIRWSHVLVPERKQPDGTVKQAGVHDLRLLNWERRSTSFVVRVSCDWDWGGREGGLIVLDTNNAFKSFSLSW